MNSHLILSLSLLLSHGFVIIQSEVLPEGPSEIYTAAEGNAKTTIFKAATRNGKNPIGILSSTVDTFIHDGTTTEYMTQQLGTYIEDKYAKIESTSTREYFFLSETESLLGLVSSSFTLEIEGRYTTEHTLNEYRTYIDGTYAHLLSSKKNILSNDPLPVDPTPNYIFSIVSTQTIGSPSKYFRHSKDLSREEEKNKNEDNEDNERDKEGGNVIKARSIDENQTITPSRVTKSIPTFTVDANGTFDLPEIEAPQDNDIESTFHRFDNSVSGSGNYKTKALDTVTYVGFVDFTTTIDDTVVIFKPKNNFKTSLKNEENEVVIASTNAILQIKPSASIISESSKGISFNELNLSSSLGNRFHNNNNNNNINVNNNNIVNNNNPLKNLLASRRNKFSKLSGNLKENEIYPTSSSSIDISEHSTTLPGHYDSDINSDFVSTIQSTIESDVELIYKTLYTTYTYFTTFFRGSTTRVKSREDVISNIVTLTNILESSDLVSLKKSCEVDSTCVFASFPSTSSIFSSDIPYTKGFIGRPNVQPSALYRRQQNGRKLESNDNDKNNDVTNTIYKTFFTTYTYFTTLLVNGSSSVSTRSEIYSNVQSSGVSLTSSSFSPFSSSTSPFSHSSFKDYSSLVRHEDTTFSAISVESLYNDKNELGTTIMPSTPQEDESTTVEPTPQLDTTLNDAFLETSTTTTSFSRDEEEVTEESESENDKEKSQNESFKLKTYYTTFTYYTTQFKNGSSFVTSNLETVTNTGTLPSASISVSPPSVTFFTTFTYWTTLIDGDKTVTKSSEETLTNILPASSTLSIQPTAVETSISFEDTAEALKKLPRAFTPNIRPNLIRPRTRSKDRLREKTTVAIVTRSDVTPTLIATPVSSSLQPTPILEELQSIAPISPLINEGPSIVSGLGLRRPNPFRERLKERQRQHLENLRSQNNENENENNDEQKEKEEEVKKEFLTKKVTPTFNLPSSIGGQAPIFVSARTQKFKRPIESTTTESSFLEREQRAKTRINSLFKQRSRPFNRFSPFKTLTEEREEFIGSTRKKRQVSEYGARTIKSSNRFPHSSSLYNDDDDNDNLTFSDDDLFSRDKSRSLVSYEKYQPSLPTTHKIRQARQQVSDIKGRSISRFNARARPRTRSQDLSNDVSTTTTTTALTPATTTSRNRFRPKIQSGRSKNLRFPSTSSPSPSSGLQKRPLRSRKGPSRLGPSSRRTTTPKSQDYEYYDYENTDIQSSKPHNTPSLITITRHVQINTAIPVFENGKATLRNVITASPTFQIIAATDLKSTNIDNSPVIYATAITNSPRNGVQEITFEALKATESNIVEFTPTRIRGIRTSFAHTIPTTIYNINPVSTTLVTPIDQSALLSQLLLQLLGNQNNNNAAYLANNAPIPQHQVQPQLAVAPSAFIPQSTTQYVTHTSKYVTTISKYDSTVVTITLRGREIETTLVDGSTEVITATEYITETIVPTNLIQPTPSISQYQYHTNNNLEALLPDLKNQLLAAQERLSHQQFQKLDEGDLSEAASEPVTHKVESPPDSDNSISSSQPTIIINVRSEVAVVEGTVSPS